MTPDELIEFTDATGENVEMQAKESLKIAAGLVNAYCRGRHLIAGQPRPGIEEVTTAVAARILANPEQIQQREQIGPYSYFKSEGFKGFTLAELAVLDRYRQRAV